MSGVLGCGALWYSAIGSPDLVHPLARKPRSRHSDACCYGFPRCQGPAPHPLTWEDVTYLRVYPAEFEGHLRGGIADRLVDLQCCAGGERGFVGVLAECGVCGVLDAGPELRLRGEADDAKPLAGSRCGA